MLEPFHFSCTMAIHDPTPIPAPAREVREITERVQVCAAYTLHIINNMVMNLTYCPDNTGDCESTLKGFKEGIHIYLVLLLQGVT